MEAKEGKFLWKTCNINTKFFGILCYGLNGCTKVIKLKTDLVLDFSQNIKCQISGGFISI